MGEDGGEWRRSERRASRDLSLGSSLAGSVLAESVDAASNPRLSDRVRLRDEEEERKLSLPGDSDLVELLSLPVGITERLPPSPAMDGTGPVVDDVFEPLDDQPSLPPWMGDSFPPEMNME
jgi:hypothetical protein